MAGRSGGGLPVRRGVQPGAPRMARHRGTASRTGDTGGAGPTRVDVPGSPVAGRVNERSSQGSGGTLSSRTNARQTARVAASRAATAGEWSVS
jgi:hypothetical protein